MIGAPGGAGGEHHEAGMADPDRHVVDERDPLPLPNGNVLVNDDYNDRVIVISRKTNRIVWQYGHDGVPGRAAGYLNNPDGVNLAPPQSLLMTHAATMGRP